MNTMINDNRERVYVVGQEGSIAWCKEKFPILINIGNDLYNKGSYSRSGLLQAQGDFIDEIKFFGATKYLNGIMKASLFGQNDLW
jgi:hypothetical protein